MDIEQNNFRRNAKSGRAGCSRCLCQAVRVARFFPFALITVFYCWGIYVYLYYVIYGFYQSLVLRILLVLGFVPFYTLSIWSYFRTVFAVHRPIGFEFYLPEEMNLNRMTEEEINQQLESVIQARNLPIFTRAYNGYVRYCRKCLLIKPDRAHHCSTCGKCICKMDHHCHWVSNCVAYDNYKFFLQFLAYTILLAFYTVASSVQLFIKFWKDESYPGKFQVFFLVVFCFIFSISILFLLSYHIYLVCRNVTTLEAYQPPRFKQFEYDFYRFNLGTRRNVMSVFGDHTLYWFLPIYSSIGDGVQFEMFLNPGQYDKSNNLTCTNPTAEPNATFPIMSSQVANI